MIIGFYQIDGGYFALFWEDEKPLRTRFRLGCYKKTPSILKTLGVWFDAETYLIFLIFKNLPRDNPAYRSYGDCAPDKSKYSQSHHPNPQEERAPNRFVDDARRDDK